ncbi:hypothetical protein D3C79_1091670 [compost metagenome]
MHLSPDIPVPDQKTCHQNSRPDPYEESPNLAVKIILLLERIMELYRPEQLIHIV